MIVTGLAVAGFFGVGTVLRWSVLRVLRETETLGPLAARVLPMLMIAFLFFFYNAEIWQVMVALSTERTWAVVGILALLTVLLVAVTTNDGLRSMLAEHASEREGIDVPPLRRSERFNLLLVPCLAALIQATLFAVVVFGFFMLFGWLSVSEATAAQWTGRPAQRFPGLLAQVPISPTLVKVSLTLAAFSALNLAASAAADRQHRERFVDPLLDEVVNSLQVRDAYVRAAASAAER